MAFILFLHALGAAAIGFYLLLPFVAARLRKLAPAAQSGFAGSLQSLNRFGQWLLVVQFLTGGYLISQYELSVLWMVVVIVLLIALGAVSGMLGGPLKRIAGASGGAAESDISRTGAFSAIAAALVFVLLILMYFPEIL